MRVKIAGRSKKAALGCLLAAAMLAILPTTGFAQDLEPSVGPAQGMEIAQEQVMRANTGDTYYAFNMASGGTYGTGGRAKEDASSTYVKIDSISRACRLYVDGGATQSGAWYNQTVNGYARATGVGKWRIRQNVYENGFRWARLTAWANEGASNLAGWWSPDSWGNYTSLN